GERADQAAHGLPADGAGGGGAARPPADPGVRDPPRRRLPSLLPRVPRARRPGPVLPACVVPRHPARDRAEPRPARSGGTRPHVTQGVPLVATSQASAPKTTTPGGPGAGGTLRHGTRTN